MNAECRYCGVAYDGAEKLCGHCGGPRIESSGYIDIGDAGSVPVIAVSGAELQSYLTSAGFLSASALGIKVEGLYGFMNGARIVRRRAG